jgi:hypothetical protein
MKKKKCPHCKLLFTPNARNGSRQKYCCKTPECRKASKKNSQRRWLEKPENQDYFRSKDNLERVRRWRIEHPGYWRKKTSEENTPLQDSVTPQQAENITNTLNAPKAVFKPLQDIVNAQSIVLLGLIANITGVALQDDMEITIARLIQLGLDITNQSSNCKGECHDIQTAHFSPTGSKDPQTIQLAGSPPGP